MSPICKQMTGEPYRSVAQAASTEEVVAEAESPTPSLTPPETPSPPHVAAAASPPLAAASPPLVADAGYHLADGEQEDASRRRLNPYPLLQDPSNDCLPIDHNLPQVLRQVTGQNNLRTVRELRLRVISREMSLQRLSLFTPNLREMNLDGSCLTSLRDLGCALSGLQVLRVARCGLDSLDGLLTLGSLRELHASDNKIDDVALCSCLPHIRIIDLRRNTLSDISYVQFLDACTHLEVLTLAECPAASHPGYRAEVRRMLPNLLYLDETPLSPRADQEYRSFNRSIFVDSVADNRAEPEHLVRARVTAQPDKPTTSKTVRFCLPEDAPGPSNIQMKSASANEASLGATQKRPASSTSSRRPIKPTAPYRPLSASASESGARSDSPSSLTSGRVVCGNLTAALRNRRKRCEAWGGAAEPQQSQEQPSSASIQELAMASGEAPESSSVMQETDEDLLNISRKWREEYKLYRDEHRERWKKEKEEGGEEVEGSGGGGEEPSPSVSSVLSKRGTTTCCPHLFAPKKEDTSKNKRTSRFPPKR